MIKSKFYICPITGFNLYSKKNYLYSKKKNIYFKIERYFGKKVVNFVNQSKTDKFYIEKKFYTNYLNWLSKTLVMSLEEIRKEIFSDIKIKKKAKILFIGCGFGDEIKFFIKKYGGNHKIFAQDISKNMVIESARLIDYSNINFSISNAESLPYMNDYFDLVFHFGGFNQFKNKKKSIDEMFRVSKEKGEIFFSDEGMGPWLSKTERYKALKINNSLWSSKPPLNIIPKETSKVIISWILKNNFYTVRFRKNRFTNKINPNIRHKSPRGGSIKSRYEDYYKKKLKL